MSTFLHLSDLHFVSGAISPDQKEIQNVILQALLNDVKEQDRQRKIDFIVFSGDMVQGGTSYSFEQLDQEFIQPLLKSISLPKERFFFVPGNHDIQISNYDPYDLAHDKELIEQAIQKNTIESMFEKLSKGEGPRAWELLLTRFQAINEYKEKLYDSEPDCHILTKLYSIHTFNEGIKIGVACFNSCFSCFGERSEGAVNQLYFPMIQIKHAIKELQDAKIKIAVLHHPIHWLRSWLASDASKVERQLVENFDFIVYGHVHEEDAKKISIEDQSACFCQGGYLSLRNKNRSSYSIVSFGDATETMIKGEIFYRELRDDKYNVQSSLFENGHKSFTIKKVRNYREAPRVPLQIDSLTKPDAFIKQMKRHQVDSYHAEVENGAYLHNGRRLECINKSISDVNFSSIDLSFSVFAGTEFNRCHFSDVCLNNTDFKGCVFKNVDFTHISSFFSVAYSSQMKQVCAGGNGAIVFFGYEDERLKKTAIIKGDFKRVLCLAWHGEFLAMTSSDGYLSVWDGGRRNDPIANRKDDASPVYATQWSPDGNYIAATYRKTEIRIYELNKQDECYVLQHSTSLESSRQAHTKQILALAWSPDGKWLVSSGIDKRINIWNVNDVHNCEHRRMFTLSHFDYIRRICWAQDSNAFFTCSDDGHIIAWALEDGADGSSSFFQASILCLVPNEDNNDVISMALNPRADRRIIAAGLRDDQIALVTYSPDYKELQCVFKEKLHKGRVWDLCWDEDGSNLFSVGNEGKLKISYLLENRLQADRDKEYEVKIRCSNMQIHDAKGLNIGGYRVTKNKDMPDEDMNGTLGEFLESNGAIGFEI